MTEVRRYPATTRESGFNSLLDIGRACSFRSRARGAGLRRESHASQARLRRHVREAPQHFSESEIVEITWLNAVHYYYNLMNIPLEIESDGLMLAPPARLAYDAGIEAL
jgi:hypothetical protein